MKLSQLKWKSLKEEPKDEKSIGTSFLIRAGFIEKVGAGIYEYLPFGLMVLNKITKIIREEMKKIGGQEILMPSLHPLAYWQITGRDKNFDALFKLKSRFNIDYVLGPTHEEIVVPLAKRYIASYKDLPLYLFQIQTKFRDEARPKSGILRAKEFLMKDLYSFHPDEEDLNKYYEKVKESYTNIFKKLELKTIVTEASGGTFSKFSHEFQVPIDSGEDTIFYCPKGHFARNKEIIEKMDKCPKCKGKLEKIKGIEVGNIFKLKDKYSKPFNLTYKNKNGKDKLVMMGCYGIGISRILGTLAEVNHDKNGLIWPEIVSPYKYHLLTLKSGDKKIDKKIEKSAEKIYLFLIKNNVEVAFDDRELSAGEKFMDADLIGAPIRIVISKNSLEKESMEIKKRESKSFQLLKLAKCDKLIS
ncbi:MAG: aminoacyl--tRNA ligase-related protein [Minisyncoccia bacterium]